MKDRQIKSCTLYYCYEDILDGCTLDEAIIKIKELQYIHPAYTHLKFKMEGSYDSRDLTIIGNRYETDKEYDYRIKRHKQKEERIKRDKEKKRQDELDLLSKLEAKYRKV